MQIFIKKLFSSSSFSAVRVVSTAYLRLLIFLLAILSPACASSSPAFFMMYSAFKFNKQGDKIQPWCSPFPIWNQSVFPCPVLTSWPAYQFLKRWVRWYSHLFQNFPVYCDPHSPSLWHSQKSRNRCFFLELSCFFDDPGDVGNLISGSSTFSKTSLNIWKFEMCTLLYLKGIANEVLLYSTGKFT